VDSVWRIHFNTKYDKFVVKEKLKMKLDIEPRSESLLVSYSLARQKEQTWSHNILPSHPYVKQTKVNSISWHFIYNIIVNENAH
jgi:hypothetical protein